MRRVRREVLALLVILLLIASPARDSHAQAAPPAPAPPPAAAAPPPPDCTTTWTVTTKCTGAAAGLAVPPPAYPPAPAPAPAPAPVYVEPPGYVPPPAYVPPAMLPSHEEMRPRVGLIIAGAAVFGGSYLWNAAGAYASGEGKLAVPLAGPFLLMKSEDGNSGQRFANAMLAFDGLVQGAGAIMLIAGAVSRHKVRVYDRVAIVPTGGPGGAGLAAFGSF